MATAINEEWDAKIGLRDCQLLDHCPKQTLAGDRRDVMEFEAMSGCDFRNSIARWQCGQSG